MEMPVGSHHHSPLQLAHTVGKVIGSAVSVSGAEFHFLSRRVAHSEVSVVGGSLEGAGAHIREIGTSLDLPLVVEAVGCLQRHGEHPLHSLRLVLSGEHTLEFLSAAHYPHVVVLHRGVNVHSLVLESQSCGQSPFVCQRLVDAESQHHAQRRSVGIERTDRGRHSHRHRSTDIVSCPEVIFQVIEYSSGMN